MNTACCDEMDMDDDCNSGVPLSCDVECKPVTLITQSTFTNVQLNLVFCVVSFPLSTVKGSVYEELIARYLVWFIVAFVGAIIYGPFFRDCGHMLHIAFDGQQVSSC